MDFGDSVVAKREVTVLSSQSGIDSGNAPRTVSMRPSAATTDRIARF
jgi:hypothetical protein